MFLNFYQRKDFLNRQNGVESKTGMKNKSFEEESKPIVKGPSKYLCKK